VRIFCALRHSADPKQYYGGLWSGNFYPALRQLGHEIIESQIDLLPTSRFMDVAGDFTPEEIAARGEITQRIIDEVRTEHRDRPIDLFLSYFYNAHFDPTGFDELRSLGIPSVNFYCNSMYQFPLVADIAAKVDYSWHPEKNARELYLRAGARPVWVQMGADPDVYRPLPDVPRRPSVCFVGQRYADRDRWLAKLDEGGVPFDLYGSGWIGSAERASDVSMDAEIYLGRRQYPAGGFESYARTVGDNIARDGLISGFSRTAKQWQYWHETKLLAPRVAVHAKGRANDIASTFAQYEVCLNFSNVWADGRPGSKLIPHVRLRDFEAPMCKTCYLTGHTDEIGDFYNLGEEIETYRTEEELIDQSRFYLTHPDAAEKLREAGYQRAIHDHTWKRRFAELFSKLELNNVN